MLPKAMQALATVCHCSEGNTVKIDILFLYNKSTADIFGRSLEGHSTL
jgi:hypothetical protein